MYVGGRNLDSRSDGRGYSITAELNCPSPCPLDTNGADGHTAIFTSSSQMEAARTESGQSVRQSDRKLVITSSVIEVASCMPLFTA